MSKLSNHQKLQIVQLNSQGVSSRKIAELLLGSKTRKSTVNDYLMKIRKESTITDSSRTDQCYVYTNKDNTAESVTHIVIPDAQVKEGVNTDHLEHAGKLIVHKRPTVIVCLGDFADVPSLSSYDKGNRTAEGKRLKGDIESSIAAMKRLLKPLRDLQQQQLRDGETVYTPRMVMTLGNHEDRINRHTNMNPELHNFLGIDLLQYEYFGWEVYDFLEPVVVDGITYCHYMSNPMSGKPFGGSATNILNKVGESFTVGHRQTLDVTTRFLPASGKQQWGIVAGAFYSHDEGYKGYQGNKHFRGLIMKHQVKDGSYNPMFIDLEYLKSKYGN